jgi:hypothetical protein
MLSVKDVQHQADDIRPAVTGLRDTPSNANI